MAPVLRTTMEDCTNLYNLAKAVVASQSQDTPRHVQITAMKQLEEFISALDASIAPSLPRLALVSAG